MLNDQELERLLASHESDRVERKASASDRSSIRRAICALANDLPCHQEPGVLFIGVNDDGSCAHLPITDELLRLLSDLRTSGAILPFPSMTVQRRTLRACEVAVVAIRPSDAPPVRYQGRTFVRVGPTTRLATLQEERILAERRRARDLPFDVQAVPTASLDDLDLDFFTDQYLPTAVSAEALTRNRRPVGDRLAATRMATPDRPPTPTTLGVLILAAAPRQFIPCSYIQFARFDGTELTAPVKDSKELVGPIPHLLRTMGETLRAHITVATDITTAPVAVRRPDYPLRALQQLAINAVLHRTYEGTHAPVRIYWFSDRVEIHNPGGPFGRVTPTNFGQPYVTDYRNPHLAEALRNLEHIQRFGVGIPIAREELRRNGNPPPEFTVGPTQVLATVRRPL